MSEIFFSIPHDFVKLPYRNEYVSVKENHVEFTHCKMSVANIIAIGCYTLGEFHMSKESYEYLHTFFREIKSICKEYGVTTFITPTKIEFNK